MLAGQPAVDLEGLQAAKLPPLKRVSERSSPSRRTRRSALPRARNPQVVPYRPKLSLDFAAQPTIGVGVNSFGTYAGGGMSLWWSDMLGNHNLGTAVQINTGFGGFGDTLRNSGAMLSYANTTHRWNWGVVGRPDAVPHRGFVGGPDDDTGRHGGRAADGPVPPGGAVGVRPSPPIRSTVAKRTRVLGGITATSASTRRCRRSRFDPVTGDVLGEQTQTHSLGRR